MPEWDSIAPYYDDLFEGRTVDVQFWTSLAKDMKSPILELACGTGRLTFPIAQTGASIVGIDISKPMLARAHSKLKHMALSVQRRVVLLEKNACTFTVPGKKFGAVFSPWGFLPVSEKDQRQLFESVKHHLLPGGRFVIDHENTPEPTSDWNDYHLKECKRTRGGLTLIRHAYNSGQVATKLGTILFLLDVVDSKGCMKRIITRRYYRHYTKNDIIRLVYQNDFIVENVYGDYDRSPWHQSSARTIIIARSATSRLGDRIKKLFHS